MQIAAIVLISMLFGFVLPTITDKISRKLSDRRSNERRKEVKNAKLEAENIFLRSQFSLPPYRRMTKPEHADPDDPIPAALDKILHRGGMPPILMLTMAAFMMAQMKKKNEPDQKDDSDTKSLLH